MPREYANQRGSCKLRKKDPRETYRQSHFPFRDDPELEITEEYRERYRIPETMTDKQEIKLFMLEESLRYGEANRGAYL